MDMPRRLGAEFFGTFWLTRLGKSHDREQGRTRTRNNDMLIISRTGVVVTIVSLGLALSACGYNTIPALEERAKARWSDVQNQYQRRTDLIPNLVATVQGYAAQEKSVLTAVVEARAKATQIKLDA